MISFTKYIEKTFYDEIYDASEKYFLGNIEELGITYDYDDEVEVTDVEFYVDAPVINSETVDEYVQLYIDNGEISEDGASLVEQ